MNSKKTSVDQQRIEKGRDNSSQLRPRPLEDKKVFSERSLKPNDTKIIRSCGS